MSDATPPIADPRPPPGPTDRSNYPIPDPVSYGPLRWLRGGLRAIGLTVSAPFVFGSLLSSEGRRPPAQVRPTEIGPDGEPVGLDEEQLVVAVIPLSEFYRLLRLGSENERSSKMYAGLADEHGSLFVVLSRIIFGRDETGDVGPPAQEIEGWPNHYFVEAGLITDFASIPALLRPFVAQSTGSFTRAALVHDFAYAHHPDRSSAGRKACDEAMLALMAAAGTRRRRRVLIYLGLRLGGGLAYRSAPERRRDHRQLWDDHQLDRVAEFAQAQMFTFLGTELERADVLPAGVTADLTEIVLQHDAAKRAPST